MDLLSILNFIRQNSNKGLLAITTELIQNKLGFNLIVLIDNSDRSKVLGHKVFSSYESLQQYITNLPIKYGFMYFHIGNNNYNAGASFYDQGWICIYDGEKTTVTDFYENFTTSFLQLSSLKYDQIFDCDDSPTEVV